MCNIIIDSCAHIPEQKQHTYTDLKSGSWRYTVDCTWMNTQLNNSHNDSMTVIGEQMHNASS